MGWLYNPFRKDSPLKGKPNPRKSYKAMWEAERNLRLSLEAELQEARSFQRKVDEVQAQLQEIREGMPV